MLAFCNHWFFFLHAFFTLLFQITQLWASEERISYNFVIRLKKTLEILKQVYEDSTMSRIRVFEWQKRVREDHEAVKKDSRFGRPSKSRTEVNVEWIRQVVIVGWEFKWFAIQLDMKKDNVWKIIIEDLGMSEK